MAFGLLLSVLITRLLGPEGKGIFSLFTTTAMFLFLIGKMGVGQASIYYSGLEKFDRKEVAGNAIIGGGLISIIISTLFCIFVTFNNTFFLKGLSIVAIYLLILVALFRLLNLFGKFVFLANNNIIFFNLFGITIVLLPTLLIYIFSIFFHIDLQTVIYLYSLGLLINAILIMIILFSKGLINPRFKYPIIKELIKFGTKSNVGNISKNMLLRIDIYLIAFFLSTTQVGLYSVAAGLMDRYMRIPEAISVILFQHVSSSTQDKSDIISSKVFKYTIYILIPISCGLWFLVDPLIKILYPNFNDSIAPALILLPGVFMFSLYSILSGIFLGKGKVNFHLINSTSFAALNVILNIFLIPKMGIKGAALASTIAYSLANISGLIFFSKITNIKIGKLIIIESKELNIIKNIFYKFLINIIESIRKK
jgi:O-antigen/teichoic acid export membrane protein